MGEQELAGLTAFRIRDTDEPLQGWLAASLSALDGAELGAVQLFDKQNGNFTEDDRAALVHLAQMASAAVERARLYQGAEYDILDEEGDDDLSSGSAR